MNLDALTALLNPPADPDPTDGLLELAKRFHVKHDVAKRRTPDGATRIAIDGLQVDPASQRPPDREKIADMVEHLRAGGHLEPIKVNERSDGSRWITDGQHRAAAAAICGHDEIDAHLTHKPSQEEAQDVEILTKVAADDDVDAIRCLLGAGARRQGKRLVLTLGRAGTVSYLPHDGEWIGKTERGRLQIDCENAAEVLDRLGLGGLSLQTGAIAREPRPAGT